MAIIARCRVQCRIHLYIGPMGHLAEVPGIEWLGVSLQFPADSKIFKGFPRRIDSRATSDRQRELRRRVPEIHVHHSSGAPSSLQSQSSSEPCEYETNKCSRRAAL